MERASNNLPGSKSHLLWRGIFLTADSFSVLGMLYATTWALSYRFYSRNHIPWASNHLSVRLIRFSEQWMWPMIYTFIPAVAILIFGTPFFLRSSLRWVTVAGWIIGVCALLYVGWIVSK